MNWTCPLDRGAVRVAPVSTINDTVPEGVPAAELTVTVTRAADGNVTASALIAVVVTAVPGEVSEEVTDGAGEEVWSGAGTGEPARARAAVRASMSTPGSFPSLPAFANRLAGARR